MGRFFIRGQRYETNYGRVIVYTDGACLRNGRVGARAGVGVWFRDDHPMNLSEPLSDRHKPTNQVAELVAARKAIDIALREGIQSLELRTDSRYVENCVKVWRYKWESNGWINARGFEVENRLEIEELLECVDDMYDIELVHTPAHVSYGNKMADALARAGAEDYECY